MSRIDDLERIILEADGNLEEIINDFHIVLSRFEKKKDAEKVAAAFNEFADKYYPEFEGSFTAESVIEVFDFGEKVSEIIKEEDSKKTLEEMIAEKGW